MKKWIKRGITTVFLLGVLAFAVATTSYYVVRCSTADRVFDNVEDIPHNKVALLLGTAPVTPKGLHNFYFDYRIDAAEKLYKAGKVDYFIVSGDNSKKVMTSLNGCSTLLWYAVFLPKLSTATMPDSALSTRW